MYKQLRLIAGCKSLCVCSGGGGLTLSHLKIGYTCIQSCLLAFCEVNVVQLGDRFSSVNVSIHCRGWCGSYEVDVIL